MNICFTSLKVGVIVSESLYSKHIFCLLSACNFHRTAQFSEWKIKGGKGHNFSFGLQILESNIFIEKPQQSSMLSILSVLWSVRSQLGSRILKGSIFVEKTSKEFQTSPWSGFMFLTSAHQVSPPCVMCVKMFYPVLTFLKVISSVVPLEGQMKACSTRTWGDDSSKPWAIPALGMLKVSVKIYNILLSDITTSTDTVSKNFHFNVPESKFVLWSEFLILLFHSKQGTDKSLYWNIYAGIFTNHKLFFSSKHRWLARLWKEKIIFLCILFELIWFSLPCLFTHVWHKRGMIIQSIGANNTQCCVCASVWVCVIRNKWQRARNHSKSHELYRGDCVCASQS